MRNNRQNNAIARLINNLFRGQRFMAAMAQAYRAVDNAEVALPARAQPPAALVFQGMVNRAGTLEHTSSYRADAGG